MNTSMNDSTNLCRINEDELLDRVQTSIIENR